MARAHLQGIVLAPLDDTILLLGFQIKVEVGVVQTRKGKTGLPIETHSLSVRVFTTRYKKKNAFRCGTKNPAGVSTLAAGSVPAEDRITSAPERVVARVAPSSPSLRP